MKRLAILGIIACVGLLVGSAAVIGGPAGPPGGLDVNVLNDPLAVEVTNAVPVEATIVAPADVNVLNPKLDVNIIRDSEPFQACGEGLLSRPSFTVPVDRRLVIEDGTIRGNMESDTQILIGSVETIVNGVEARHFIGRIAQSTFTFESAGRMMKAYADPGTEVTFIFSSRGTPEDVVACISGRLEPVEDGL